MKRKKNHTQKKKKKVKHKHIHTSMNLSYVILSFRSRTSSIMPDIYCLSITREIRKLLSSYYSCKIRNRRTKIKVTKLAIIDDQVNDMMDIAEADRDALFVSLKIDSFKIRSDVKGGNNSISKHVGVVFFSNRYLSDDDETE